jgi:uncharacterized protein (TIGR01777 family)
MIMNILISGGSGLVGSHLISKLTSKGHTIVNLTTNPKKVGKRENISNVYWNPSKGEIDKSCLENIDAIINLAGFNISNKWSEANKKEMIDSRVQSTNLLVSSVLNLDKKPHVFISTSASGYYIASPNAMTEESPAGNDFLSSMSVLWENETTPLNQTNIRQVILRVSVVIDKTDGAVGKMLPFFKLGMGSAIGSGKQMMSWIHLDDLTNMYIHALESNISGVFNATADVQCTNLEFSKALAKALNRPFFLPNIPKFVLQMLFGEMSTLLFQDRNLSNHKIKATGFKFNYTNIQSALNSIFQK